ncbi:hypothetical protein [Phenylobacterium sp.]|jgi:hypothetical protein|uniref:hypothetical protein n=1 Tax=Phenylobacterium sp. TaxID=1871053 RepID=UPI002F93D64D
MTQGADQNNSQSSEDGGGRRGEPNHLGGTDKDGHLNPQVDRKDGESEGGRQIAQDSQQSSGQGMGQS